MKRFKFPKLILTPKDRDLAQIALGIVFVSMIISVVAHRAEIAFNLQEGLQKLRSRYAEADHSTQDTQTRCRAFTEVTSSGNTTRLSCELSRANP